MHGKGAAMRLISRIGEWFDERLQIAAPIRDAAEHPVPRNTASWWYVFGSAALVVFLLHLVTGIKPGLVHPRAARLGFELHGGDRPDPHDAGLSLRRV